jgi:trehalose-phosphatase
LGRDVTASSATARLAAEIARAARRPRAARILVLDLDGTLAPITEHRHDACVPATVLASLSRVHDHGWRVAIVTGRPAVEARRMVPVRGVMVFGSHGIERGGAFPVSRPLRSAAKRARSLARQARDLIRSFPGAELERKPFGCAFHYRALHGEVRARFLRRLRAWLAGHDTRGLELLRGRDAVELRPEGRGKGEILRLWPAARAVRQGDRSLVAIGDDVADEELFAALNGRGLTIRVGSRRRPTLARRRLPGTSEVAHLLSTLAAGVPGKPSHERT